MSRHSEGDEAQYRELLLRETREELQKADTKASILLAASGIAFTALLTSGSAATWFPDRLKNDIASTCGWAAIAAGLAGVVFVGSAVKPRLRHKAIRDDQIDYFGDVDSYRPRFWQVRHRKKMFADARKRYGKDMESASAVENYVERLDDQIWALSHIAYRKYRLIAVGMNFYLLALVAAVVSLVAEKVWG